MNIEAVVVAARILDAINSQTNPDDADVLLLHLYCPGNEKLDPDELACIAIQERIQEIIEEDNKKMVAKIGIQSEGTLVKRNVAS